MVPNAYQAGNCTSPLCFMTEGSIVSYPRFPGSAWRWKLICYTEVRIARSNRTKDYQNDAQNKRL